MKDTIKTILRENIKSSNHKLNRIKNRFDVFTTDDMSIEVKNKVKSNLSLLEKIDLPYGKSFAIMLGSFNPNKDSKYYKLVGGNRGYYTIIDDVVISDSTGDQFWLIVRNNVITTFMLRKAIQTADLSHNLTKLRVDEIILDLETFIRNNRK
jgi:hypothetical protein